MKKYEQSIPNIGIEGVFREDKCFGDKLLGESKKRLVIPSYNIDTNDVYIFKTAHHERFKTDYKVPAWKIARATSAAPTFFPISNNIDSIRLVDGGVWANNPAMVGLFEAIAVLDVPLADVRIFSVGTAEALKQSPSILDKFSGWPFWAKTAVELIMQSQSVSISAQLKLLLKDNFVRVNPKVPAGLFGLDKMNMDKLFAFASTHILRQKRGTRGLASGLARMTLRFQCMPQKFIPKDHLPSVP